MMNPHPPEAQGLYDPALEKDSCGVGFVVNVKGVKSHDIIEQGLHILADAAEGVLPSGQSPDERQELMARHFVDPPQLANRIAVLVDA